MKNLTIFDQALITGSDGMIGNYIDFGIRTNHRSLDITNLADVLKVCKEHKPKLIMHLAAVTDLVRSEQDPAYAYAVNSVGTYNLALAARTIGAKLVYVSTSGVFDGTKEEPYTEKDLPNPINVYGHSKYLGELAVCGMTDNYLIVRTCWIFGGGKNNDKKFVGKLIKQIDSAEIKAVNDRRGSPTYAKDLVAGIEQLIAEDKKGIFHLGNTGSATRYDIANEVVSLTGARAKVLSAVSVDFPLAYTSGANESMVSKVPYMRPWQDALREYIETEWKK